MLLQKLRMRETVLELADPAMQSNVARPEALRAVFDVGAVARCLTLDDGDS